MPEQIESYKCVICTKVHNTLHAACMCEHGHIGLLIKDNQIEEVHIAGRVYKPVPPPQDPFTNFRSEEEQRDWEHTMILGSNCG